MTTRYEELKAQVLAFHEAHPEVWELFQQFTFELIERGFQAYSARGVFHRIRWETAEAHVDQEREFKLNNNYSPFYARAFMNKYPEHEGFFRVRKQISKSERATHLPPLRPGHFDTAA